MKHCIVTAIALLAFHCVSGDVCQDLANRIDKEYVMEEVNACYKCGRHRITQDQRHSLESMADEFTGADMFRVGSPKPAWCGSDTGNDYLEITFHKVLKIGGLVIQGNGIGSWITSFKVSYYAGSDKYNDIRNEDGVVVFQGNSNEFSLEERKFPIPVKSISIRIQPVTDHTAPCMRVDVYACNAEDSAPAMMDAYKHAGYERPICTLNVLEDCGGLKCAGEFKRDSFNCEICECEEEKTVGGIFESDIDMTQQTRAALEESFGLKQDPGHVFKAARRGGVQAWLNYKKDGNLLIPYISSYGLSSRAPAAIQAAIQHLAQKTCIRLIPRKNNEQYFINFVNGGGCSSPVGGQYGGNRVSIGNGCEHTGTVVHEILHSLGFWHEQSRPDRDQHVRIITQNIRQGMVYNFQKQSASSIDSMGSPYDLKSVMHYDGGAFSRNGQHTIVTLDGKRVVGQRRGLSEEDIKQVNTMYRCQGSVTGNGKTSTTRPTIRPTTTRTPDNCVDRHRYCQYWAKRDECDKNPNYMKMKCRKSCEVCSSGEECGDKDARCPTWKNYCKNLRYMSFMKTSCPRTCGICQKK